MKIYFQKRRSGKTTKLILESHEKNMPIVCANNSMVMCVRSQAKDMGVDIPNPINIETIINGWADGNQAKAVLVDEAQTCLEAIIMRRSGYRIESMTINDSGEADHEKS